MLFSKNIMVILALVAGVSLVISGEARANVLFRDDFDGGMSGEWQIVRDDPDYYSVEANYLDLRANSGELGDTWANNAKNLFLIDTPTEGDFTITMRLNSFLMSGADHAPQVNILAFDDDDNLVRCIYGRVYGSVVLQIGADVEGEWEWQYMLDHDFGAAPFYLRLEKHGNEYTQYYSVNGTTFHSPDPDMCQVYGDGTPAKIGFAAFVDPLESSHALVDWFEVTPEPATLTLLALGGLAVLRNRRKG